MFVVAKILLRWRGDGLLLEFTLTDWWHIFLWHSCCLGSFIGITHILVFHCALIPLGSIQAAGGPGVCSLGAMAGIDLGHQEKGLLKVRAFQEKGWALLGAPSNPWVCHLGALKSQLSDYEVKGKVSFLPVSETLLSGSQNVPKIHVMWDTAHWKLRYAFIAVWAGGWIFLFVWGYISAVETSEGEQL